MLWFAIKFDVGVVMSPCVIPTCIHPESRWTVLVQVGISTSVSIGTGVIFRRANETLRLREYGIFHHNIKGIGEIHRSDFVSTHCGKPGFRSLEARVHLKKQTDPPDIKVVPSAETTSPKRQ